MSSGLHCLYRVFSSEKFEKREFLGWETSNWLPSVEGLTTGSDWFAGGGVRLRDFREAFSRKFLQNGVFNKMGWLRFRLGADWLSWFRRGA